MNIGKSIRMAFAITGKKRIDVAREMGVHTQQLSYWQKNNVMRPATMEKLCSALGMPVSEFIKLGE